MQLLLFGHGGYLFCFASFLSLLELQSQGLCIGSPEHSFIQLAVLLSWLTATMFLYKKLSDVYIKPNRWASATENNSEALCSMRFHFKHMNSSSSLGSLRIDFDFSTYSHLLFQKNFYKKRIKIKGMTSNFQKSVTAELISIERDKGLIMHTDISPQIQPT